MPYIFKGRLCGYICDECPEPLSRVTVRLYRVADDRNVTALAVASPKDTFSILGDDEAGEKKSRLIAEAETDERGNFSFELGEKQRYEGGAFEMDVYCGNVPPRLKPRNDPPPPPVQFSITTLQPVWRRTRDGAVAVFDYCVPARYWCAVLARRRLRVICGRLTTCDKPKQPIAGAEVEAFDADWLQDDSLGTAVTQADGRFTIYYTRPDFEKTLVSWLNFELVGGPDVYFVVKYAGTPIITEGQAEGRAPGRSNAPACLCVELCTDKLPHTPPEKTPHWTKVAGRFNVNDDLSAPNDNFLPEGYAGSPSEAYVFGGGVMLNGNCPLKNAAAPTNGLKYRFLAAEWGYSSGPAPGVLPDVAPPPAPSEPDATWKVVTAAGPTWVGDVYYDNGLNPFAKMSVNVSPDADGWIRLDGVSVTAPLFGGGTKNVLLSDDPLTGNWVRSGNLLFMNTAPLSGTHAPPAWASDRKNAGRSLTDAEKAIIHRFRVVFQVRDVVTDADVFTDTRDSIIFDNSTPVGFVNIEELMSDACNPITSGPGASIKVRYTVDHPHLRYFHLRIKSNLGVAHPEGSMPGGDFAAGSLFFRGGQSGPADPPNQSGGVNVDISGDPPCAYALKLRYITRHYVTGEGGDEVLYCIE
ncbi:MAG TPA: hypothetical protein VF611_12180 [Pyrinomonadaceae bacterium]|jgi:hypothetical protein